MSTLGIQYADGGNKTVYGNAKDFFDNRKDRGRQIRDEAPAAAKAFAQMEMALMSEGALSAKFKELIALAIGLAHHCPPCIRAHVAGCLEEGATREEIMEAAQVAVVMAGGPAYVHIPMVVEALDELEDREAEQWQGPGIANEVDIVALTPRADATAETAPWLRA